MIKYQVILAAEDAEYIQCEFGSFKAAQKYVDENKCRYGEGQELYIDEINRRFW